MDTTSIVNKLFNHLKIIPTACLHYKSPICLITKGSAPRAFIVEC
ncbi:MAG: hypothetical protein ACTS42_02125 [Candidatus Hodgkinia cicadicola]